MYNGPILTKEIDMTHDEIGIALGILVGILLAMVFILFVKDFEKFSEDCVITEFAGFIGILVVVSAIVAIVIH